jgi:hypothetical protein
MLYQTIGVYHKYGSSISQRIDNQNQFNKHKLAQIPTTHVAKKQQPPYIISLPPLFNGYLR